MHVAIRSWEEMDVCDEKHLGCDGMYCVGEETRAHDEIRVRKRMKVRAISTKPENQLNLSSVIYNWDGN
jgi:hypothetical protein